MMSRAEKRSRVESGDEASDEASLAPIVFPDMKLLDEPLDANVALEVLVFVLTVKHFRSGEPKQVGFFSTNGLSKAKDLQSKACGALHAYWHAVHLEVDVAASTDAAGSAAGASGSGDIGEPAVKQGGDGCGRNGGSSLEVQSFFVEGLNVINRIYLVLKGSNGGLTLIKKNDDQITVEQAAPAYDSKFFDALSFDTLIPKKFLQEDMIEPLREQKQLLFVGPPGTGKTYLAQQLSAWMLGSAARGGVIAGLQLASTEVEPAPKAARNAADTVAEPASKAAESAPEAAKPLYKDYNQTYALVQFSQSSTYADFIQGMRGGGESLTDFEIGDLVVKTVAKMALSINTSIGGSSHEPLYAAAANAAGSAIAQNKTSSQLLRLTDGPLVRLGKMRTSAEKEEATRVLVIDEINRASIPNVFGECFFLLENRGATINLRYSSSFRLSPNLYVIGTMNRADQNIGQVMDSAMAQRFAWVTLSPTHAPVSGLLGAWLRKEIHVDRLLPKGRRDDHGCDVWLPALLKAWNGVLEERKLHNFFIGPRFFLVKQLLDGKGNDLNIKSNNDAAAAVRKICKNRILNYLRLVVPERTMDNFFARLNEVTKDTLEHASFAEVLANLNHGTSLWI